MSVQREGGIILATQRAAAVETENLVQFSSLSLFTLPLRPLLHVLESQPNDQYPKYSSGDKNVTTALGNNTEHKSHREQL